MVPRYPHWSDSARSRQDELYDVVDIAATDLSFAAWRADGRVVTWGNRGNGGDSLAVQMQLKSLRFEKTESNQPDSSGMIPSNIIK